VMASVQIWMICVSLAGPDMWIRIARNRRSEIVRAKGNVCVYNGG
jgi:hypothetical protein